MRIALAFAALCLLGGCSAAQIQQACAYDAAGQPIAVATIGIVAPAAGAAAPGIAAGLTLDTTVIHPAIQGACPGLIAAAQAKAASITPAPAAAPSP